jgi:DNA-binding NtrC family response regulator
VAPGKKRQSQEEFRKQVEAFGQLAQNLTGALEGLVVTAEVLESSHAPVVEVGVDFYAEVQRFETALIKRALRHCGGLQRSAAALLKLNPTTLHSKLEQYEIKAREYKRAKNLLSVIR